MGGAWLIIHPLAQSLVLAIVLSQLLGARLSGIESKYAYAVYLLSGILAWSFFAETTSNCISMFRDRANLIKKINFPRVCIPLIVIGTSLVNHLILMLVTILIVWALGIDPKPILIFLPVLIFITLGLALGIGLILSVFDVFVRDIGNVWQIVVQFGFWLTPIVYVADILPENVQPLLKYNPMYWITNSYQQVIGYGVVPVFEPLAIIAGIVVLLLSFGFILFIRAGSDVVDAL